MDEFTRQYLSRSTPRTDEGMALLFDEWGHAQAVTAIYAKEACREHPQWRWEKL